jgi:hypothetical protein
MRYRAATALLAVLAAAAGITGCGRSPLFATPPTHEPKPCTIRIQAPPSAVAILVHRGSASSRAELNAILLTASPNEHIFIFKAATGKLLGSFTTPPGPALPSPIPPPPLPSDPTQVQRHAYSQEIVPYDNALRQERARLHLSWLARLNPWASYVMSKASLRHPMGPPPASELPGLVHGLAAAGASITSLGYIPGIHLGTRIVVAILGLEKVPVSSPPPLPGGLQGATVLVAGFTGNSSQEATWRTAWTREGARKTVLLTPSTNDELPAVVAPVLKQGSHRRQGGC